MQHALVAIASTCVDVAIRFWMKDKETYIVNSVLDISRLANRLGCDLFSERRLDRNINDYISYFAGRKIVAGVSVLAESYIIPFKMYAWLDLKRRKEAGEHVNERDYKKHKNDVFRLLQIVNTDEKVSVGGLVRESVEKFLEEIAKEQIRVEQLGIMITKEEAMELLKNIYL